MPDGEPRDAGGEARGARDAASVLPFVVTVLFVPPIILIFAAPLSLAGVPLIVLYLFGVWALAIVAAFMLARKLAPKPPAHGREGRPGGPPS